MKVFHCDHCGRLLFFENSKCGGCGRLLAYVAEIDDMTSLDPIEGGRWSSPRAEGPLRLCANYQRHNICNWALPADDPNDLCRSCRLTRMIPDLSREGNVRRWYKLEVAKRRLVYTLTELGLPLKNRVEDAKGGLAFEFLEDPPPGSGAPAVMTGHADGVITVNIAEADDAERVKRRVQLNEPYRTLIGHFRHESGHYYWDRLLSDSPRLGAFRALFGDDRVDYAASLQRHYDQPRHDWHNEYVSAYATMHPWEDWAETWAHYLHITDSLETASACGVSILPVRGDEPRLTMAPDPNAGDNVTFDRLMEGWGAIVYVLNNLNRGLGNDDAYPFVLSPKSIEKLRFVHETVRDRVGAPVPV